jgi:tetratricopeptide (TPR) repeat protein
MKKSNFVFNFLSFFIPNSAGETELYRQSKNSSRTKCQEVVKLNHHDHANAQEYLNRGILKMRLGRYNEAIIYLKQAVEFNPDMPKVYYNLGISYEFLNDFENAKYYFRKTTDLNARFTQDSFITPS